MKMEDPLSIQSSQKKTPAGGPAKAYVDSL